MKKSSIQLLFAATVSVFASASHAQLGGLSNALGGSGGSISAEQMVSKYVSGSKNVTLADAKMLEAVGLKDEAAKAALQAQNLTEGATKGNLENADKVQTESSKALEEKLNGKKVTMDAAGKKLFASGLKDLAVGMIQYVGMSKDVSSFKPSITSIGGSAKSALYVVKTLPSSIKNLGTTLKAAIDFSKENDIPIPKEATDATALL